MAKVGRPTKICGKCKLEKSSSSFYADNRSKSGLQVNCKECLKKYYSENRERYRSLKNGNEKYKDKMKDYFNRNKDKINLYKKERYASDEGKAKVKAVNNRRRALKKTSCDGTVTGDFILNMLIKQEYKCAITGLSLINGYHVDHIIPLAKGGLHTASNIQLLLPSVNMSKKDSI